MMKFKNGLHELVCQVVFAGAGQGIVVAGINEGDFVVIGIEADAGFGDIVGDDQVTTLADELVAGMGGQGRCRYRQRLHIGLLASRMAEIQPARTPRSPPTSFQAVKPVARMAK